MYYLYLALVFIAGAFLGYGIVDENTTLTAIAAIAGGVALLLCHRTRRD